jgi:hypothetical protein
MSTINTNSLDVNYPIPGQNNSSQGFRTNFASIKNNLDIAGNEITDLQNKVVLKSALANSSINNDMANTLISNAATLNFRATTYNLGSALAGNLVIDTSLADVQYGVISEDVTLNFGNWAPVGTERKIQLLFNFSNANAKISFPSEVVSSNNNYGLTILENYGSDGLAYVTCLYNVSQLNFLLTSTDCGNTIYIEPTNRPYKASQLIERTPPSTGYVGDTAGTVCIDPSLNQLTLTSTLANDVIVTSGTTTQLYTDLPVVFTAGPAGVTTETNLTLGTTYYVRNVVSSTEFTVSSSLGGANVNLTGNVAVMYANPISYLYVATDDYNGTPYEKNVLQTYSNGTITLTNTTSLANNAPVHFTSFPNANTGGLDSNLVYYIKSISGNDITISRTRTNGAAGSTVTLTNYTPAGNSIVCVACVTIGNDIYKRVPLTPF